jgi:predicted ATPase
MISRIEAQNFRCFRDLSQNVGSLQVLVGPNGSGKSTFLDIVSFLGVLTAETVQSALQERSESFHDLVWGRQGNQFSIAIEAAISEDKRAKYESPVPDTVRYEVALRIDTATDSVSFAKESIYLKAAGQREDGRPVMLRDSKGLHFRAEVGRNDINFELSQNYSGLSNLPLDEKLFPAAAWLKLLLRDGIRNVTLDRDLLRSASPPSAGRTIDYDGWNLPRLVARLSDDRQAFGRWVAHLRTALPNLETVKTSFRPEDKYRYLVLVYRNGIEIPQWLASDGTLRLLALTILAYLNEPNCIYLIEEPENGVHPTALETIFQSLSSVYNGQVIVTSHSPVLLALVEPKQLLCFTLGDMGVEVVRGDQHPALRDWRDDLNLSDLFAAGVLG